MAAMKALHVASFDGNIGDIANHAGFWNLFRKHVKEDVETECMEMREFYQLWGIRKFDDGFIDTANRFDFIVFGGGTFFDVRWDYSETGTTIDLSHKTLSRIKVPMVFNALGVSMDGSALCRRNVYKFEKFLGEINDRRSCVVSVRNDGSFPLLKKYLASERHYSNVFQIPDGGFFTSANSFYHAEIPKGRDIVAVNVANDCRAERWGSDEAYREYCMEFADFINSWLAERPDTYFVFVPHIPQDLNAVSDIISRVSDRFLRRDVSVAPYLNGKITPGEYLIDLYRKSDAAIGMRHHANVCSIAMGTPTVGIFTLDRHIELYRNIGIENRLCDVSHSNFSQNLKEKLLRALLHKKEIIKENKSLVKKLEEDSLAYFEAIKRILPV